MSNEVDEIEWQMVRWDTRTENRENGIQESRDGHQRWDSTACFEEAEILLWLTMRGRAIA